MGAHLTTLSEWQAARDEERGGKALWNLRDATWKAADDYFIRNIKGTSGADGLNPRGWQRFRSDDEDPGSVWDAKFRPASQTTYDDGAVLPIAAEPDPETERSGLRGRKFFHVIGNVWQAVEVDAANPAAKLPGETKYAVVGGSAISAPELGSELPLRLTKSELEGATDIGFRISFKAPLQPPRVLLTEAIHSAGKFLHD
jgi:hypothetical protein